MKNSKEVVNAAPLTSSGAETPATAPAVIPSPPGGGAWRWNGSTWDDLNPKPAEPAAVLANVTE